MRSLATFIVQGPLQAIAVIAVAGLAALWLAPLAVVSGGALGLVALGVGDRQSLMVMVGAAVVASVVAHLSAGAPVTGLLLVPLLWVPVWLLTAVWRVSGSLGYALHAATLVGVLLAAALHVAVGEPTAFWREPLERMVQPALEQGALGENPEQVLSLAAQQMNGILAAGLVLVLALSLFLARYWHGLVYNGPGLREAFVALDLGRPAAGIAVLVAVLAWGVGGPPLNYFVAVLAVPFLLQGLAVAHALVAGGLHKGWLIGLYVLLGLFPQALLIVALAGLADTWMQFRSRLPSG